MARVIVNLSTGLGMRPPRISGIRLVANVMIRQLMNEDHRMQKPQLGTSHKIVSYSCDISLVGTN